MTKFRSLSPKKARELEEEAIEKFKGKVSKEAEPAGFLHKVKSVFPFQLFPDELLIERDKLTLTIRFGPGMEDVRSMKIRDIAQVEADCGPVFGHLHVYPKLRTEEPMLIERLFRKEALAARKIIEDLIAEHPQKEESSY